MSPTFVTAASSNHFKSLCQLLETLRGQRVFVYDLGLTSGERDHICSTFEVIYRTFPFHHYPPHVSLSAQDAGAYAWKPIIVSDVFAEIDGVLIWCDAGNKVTDPVALEQCVRSTGVYTPTSSGTIATWTHPIALATMGVPKQWYGFTMRNAACIGFLKGSADPLVAEWRSFALDKNAILPLGANRSNHRHDQSILTFLYYKYKVVRRDEYVGFSIHNDID